MESSYYLYWVRTWLLSINCERERVESSYNMYRYCVRTWHLSINCERERAEPSYYLYWVGTLHLCINCERERAEPSYYLYWVRTWRLSINCERERADPSCRLLISSPSTSTRMCENFYLKIQNNFLIRTECDNYFKKKFIISKFEILIKESFWT